MNEIKEEFIKETKYLIRQNRFSESDQLAIWNWISQELTEAKIEENKSWLIKSIEKRIEYLIAPDHPVLIDADFEYRITELEKELEK